MALVAGTCQRVPATAIELHVLGQDIAEMPLAEDQHVIQALAAKRAHDPFRVRIHLR